MIAEFVSQHAVLVLLGIFCVMAILFILVACLAASANHTDLDDEDQMHYLAEWKKRKEGTKK